jgi:hypothetical protein
MAGHRHRRRVDQRRQPVHLIGLLAALAKTNQLYYLHPSFGYYFEQFYLEPHGLVYKLKTLPEDTLLPPPLDKNLIAENEAFWARAEAQAFASIERAVAATDPNARKLFPDKIFTPAHWGRAKPECHLPGLFTRAAWISGAWKQRVPVIWLVPPHILNRRKN